MNTSSDYPTLRSGLYAQAVAQGVVIIGENERRIFNGPAFAVTTPLLDGTRSEGELLRATAGKVSPPEFFYVLQTLRNAGLLAVAADKAGQAHFWDALGRVPPVATLHIQSVGSASYATLLSELGGLGLPTDGEKQTADLRVVVAEHYLHPALADINREALASGHPWLPVKLTGRRLWVGPLMQPGQTGCWACLAQRLSLNSQVEDFLTRQTGEPPDARTWASTALTQAIAGSLAAQEIAHALADRQRLKGRLLTLDWLSRESGWHVLTRRPQCPVCGSPENYRHPRKVAIGHAAKVEGGHRCATAEETARRFADLVSPITGVVNWLVSRESDAHGLSYNVSVGHNFLMGHNTVEWLRRSLDTKTGGKGGSSAEAQASAIGEAVERYLGVFRGEEPVRRASYLALGEEAVHPREFLCFSEDQYARRGQWNKTLSGSLFHAVPNPFDETVELDWSPVWSLSAQRFRYFPASYCYFGHPDSARHFFFTGDTNGCASGNCLEEAFCYAFYELVERDGVALWWYNQARRPAVDVDSFALPGWKRLQDYYRGLGRVVWVLDLTTDLGLPTFVALSARIDQAVEDIIFGFAAHLDPRTALQDALNELNQFLPAVSRQNQDGSTRYVWPEDEAIHWWKHATRANQPYLLPNPKLRLRRFPDDFSEVGASADIGTDMRACVARAEQCGLEVYALDMSQPDIGMKVCRVIVPGLRHFWRRLAPGRLYDTPVALGWIATPRAENQMNPYSIFV